MHRLRFPSEYRLVLRGAVTDAGGEPVSGATVRALPSSWNSRLFLPVEATTGADGDFVLYGLGPGNLKVEVQHARYSTRVRTLSLREETPAQNFELGRRAVLGGRLTGFAVPSGTRLEVHQPGELRSIATVDEAGHFQFEGELSAGSAELTLLDPSLCFVESGSRWLKAQVEEGGATELELEVAQAAVVRGVVRDAAGDPLPDVRVLLEEQKEGPLAPLRLLAVTDAQGAYEVQGLPRVFGFGLLSKTRFVFRRHGFAVGELSLVGASVGDALELSPVVMVRPGSISGRVTRNGRGVAGAVAFTGYGRTAVHREVTDRDGSFVLRELRPGKYRVKVRYGTMPLSLADEVVEVTAGQDAGPVEVQLPAGRTITGRVIAPDGAAIEDALVVVRGQRGDAFYSGADGEFTLDTPREEVELQVFEDVEFRVQETVVVPLSQDDVTIELPMVPVGTVRARLVGLPGRRPLPGCVMRLEPLGSSAEELEHDHQRRVRARWVATEGGALDLRRFPAGHTRLVLHCPGYAPLRREVEIGAGEVEDLGTLLFEPGAGVRGVVLDGQGQPVPDALVHLGHELDLAIAPAEVSVFTDAAGNFSLLGVGKHATDVVVSANGFATVTVPLDLPGDLLRTDRLKVTLDAGASIDVRVENERADNELSIVILKKFGQRVDLKRTNRLGRVTFAHLSPGRYEVYVLGEAAAVGKVEVLTGGGPYEVDVVTRASR